VAQLPNGDNAFLDPLKLTGYVLDPAHRTGRHKARVFAAVLGITSADAPALASALLRAASVEDASLERADAHGAHYAIEFILTFGGRSCRVRSLWTIRHGEEFPRFVSAFVAKQDAQYE
jgi:hypothetical protein